MKTATDFLTDLLRYKDNRMTKAEITKRWKGHSWSTEGLTKWARFYWMENVK
jgi:hypothetical protein